MDNPQLVEYIRQQLAAGHPEATIRQHLLKHGWQAVTINAALKRNRRKWPRKSATGTVSKNVSATRRPRRRSKRTWRLAGLCLILVALLGGFMAHRAHSHTAVPQPTAPTQLTHQQKQTGDVITIGGAVGQYVAANNNTLPLRTAPGPSANSVVLCGKTCDPTTWQVSALSAYKAANVRIVPYSRNMPNPNVDTLLLVTGVRCKNDMFNTENTTPLSMVAAYATDTTEGVKQHCVSL